MKTRYMKCYRDSNPNSHEIFVFQIVDRYIDTVTNAVTALY